MKIFKAKVGYELLIPVLMVLLGTMIIPLYESENTVGLFTMLAVMVPVIVFVLILFFNTTYTILAENQLHIKCGFIVNQKVDIMRIKSVVKTSSIISSPAPSVFGRIEIKYGKYDSVIISPKDKETFMSELLKINPNISISI